MNMSNKMSFLSLIHTATRAPQNKQHYSQRCLEVIKYFHHFHHIIYVSLHRCGEGHMRVQQHSPAFACWGIISLSGLDCGLCLHQRGVSFLWSIHWSRLYPLWTHRHKFKILDIMFLKCKKHESHFYITSQLLVSKVPLRRKSCTRWWTYPLTIT